MALTLPSKTEGDQGLDHLVRSLALTLAASDEAIEAVNADNRARFHQMCRTLGLAPTDAVALLCRPPEVTLAKSQVVASVRLSSTKTRETGITLSIGGRVVDSFYQKRFGSETTRYQRITVDLERVATLDDVLVTDAATRGTVQSLLRAFVRKHKEATGGNIEAWVKQARRVAHVQTFRRVLILTAAEGWVCLLPPSAAETGGWLSLYLTRTGDVLSPVPKEFQFSPAGTRAVQDFVKALSRVALDGTVEDG